MTGPGDHDDRSSFGIDPLLAEGRLDGISAEADVARGQVGVESKQIVCSVRNFLLGDELGVPRRNLATRGSPGMITVIDWLAAKVAARPAHVRQAEAVTGLADA